MSSDETPKKRPLSEIGHLFLSNVRDLHNNGQGRPRRTPPSGPQQPPQTPAEPTPSDHAEPPGGRPFRTDFSIDLTPEEFAEVFAGQQPMAADDHAADGSDLPARVPQVTALIATHLNGKQSDRCREFARHLAAREGRVGLMELDASEFRLTCYEGRPAPAALTPEPPAEECCDPRQMAEAIEELNCDVDRWLLLLPNPRLPEARALLRLVDHWVVLSTCDHDGVVGSYRTLKGLSDLHRPKLSLALLDTGDDQDVVRVYRKLSGVCEQFLDWKLDLETEPAVRKNYRVAEHLVLVHRPHRDKAQLANPVQWPVVADFLARAKAAAERQQQDALEAQKAAAELPGPEAGTAPSRELVGELVIPLAARPSKPVERESATREKEMPVPETTQPESVAPPQPSAPVSAPPAPPMTIAPADTAEHVIDLPNPDASPDSILSAVLRGGSTDFVECPVRPPMCVESRLAVSRERGVVLFAVARQGLSDLRAIGRAYQWLIENRSLIGMAVPQFAIDPAQAPRLRLLVDHGDLSAEVLQPMLQSGHVTVQSYRKLRWGGRTGLLLEAA